MGLLDNASKPAPKWFRKLNPIFSNLETLVVAIWMLYDPMESKGLLIFKLISGFVRTNLGILMANGVEYAISGTTDALVAATGAATPQAAVVSILGSKQAENAVNDKQPDLGSGK